MNEEADEEATGPASLACQGGEDPVNDEDNDEENVKQPRTTSGGRSQRLLTIGGRVWEGAKLPPTWREEEQALPTAPTGRGGRTP